MGDDPDAISSDGTHVWVANYNDNTVTELDASTGSVVQTIGVGNEPDGVSSDGTHVWVTNAGQHGDRARRFDGSVVQTIAVGSDPNGVSSDGTHVWVANYGDTTVTELAMAPVRSRSPQPRSPTPRSASPTRSSSKPAPGTPPYSWNKYLPKGRASGRSRLSLSKSGLISGMPKKAGTYTIIVKCLQATATPAQDPCDAGTHDHRRSLDGYPHALLCRSGTPSDAPSFCPDSAKRPRRGQLRTGETGALPSEGEFCALNQNPQITKLRTISLPGASARAAELRLRSSGRYDYCQVVFERACW